MSLAGLLAGGSAMAKTGVQALPVAQAPADREDLQLEVVINGRTTDLVASVVRWSDGRLAMKGGELNAVGLAAPDTESLIPLDQLPGVEAAYDEDGQRLLIHAAVAALKTRHIDLRAGRGGATARQDFGAVLNYALSADFGEDGDMIGVNTLGATLDGRVFGRFGSLRSAASAIYTGGDTRVTRLDTTWSWYDQKRAVGLRGGDFISGGFGWTRPIRMAGFQIRRDFAVRPDLVTMPSPRLSASAAAPSTLELYMNNAPILSRPVGAGPIVIDGLPSSQGFSQARLVLRDAAGQATTVVAPFFATPLLLRKGLADFSLEGGFARRFYGQRSADYDGAPVASGSLRYGVSDALTLEAHAEGGSGVASAGGGISGQLGGLGVASMAGAVSHSSQGVGGLMSAVFDSRFAGIYINAQVIEATAAYRDLASATAPKMVWRGDAWTGGEPPRSIRQLSLSAPLAFKVLERLGELPLASFSYSHQRTNAGVSRDVFSTSVRQTLGRRITAYASGYLTSGADHGGGVQVGVTVPLGGATSVSVGGEKANDGASAFVEAARAETQAAGSTAWRLRAEGGDGARLEGQIVRHTQMARLSAVAGIRDGRFSGQAEIDGSIAALGGAVIAADRVDGAFALADVGAPNVPVLFQNQVIGRSDRNGRILVRNLGAFEDNIIEIEASALPLDLDPARTRTTVSPLEDGGVIARFGVSRAAPSALVTFRFGNGEVVPAGAEVATDGTGERIIVGYDGQALITAPKPRNHVTIFLDEGRTCVADFAFTPQPQGAPRAVAATCH